VGLNPSSGNEASAEIRALGPGDEELLHRAVRTFLDTDAAVPDLFLADPRAHAFVALDGDAIVGWCHGYEVFHPKGRWMVVLMGLAVAESHRPRGGARGLLERFAELAAAKGLTRVWLVTDAGADVARRLFPGTTVEPAGRLGHWWVFG
jgi:GNAT superfamily N-acetyltransferase